MASIAQQLSDLINPKPTFDPEDDIDEDTRAKLIDKDAIDTSDYTLPRSVGFFRGTVEEDPKYEGKIISRKEMMDDDSIKFNCSNTVPYKVANGDYGSNEELSISAEEYANDSESAVDDEEIDSDMASGASDVETSAPSIFQHTKLPDKSKGLHTMNQMTVHSLVQESQTRTRGPNDAFLKFDIINDYNMWESLLETRIKAQKLLFLANQLPRPCLHPTFVDQGGNEIVSSVNKTVTSLSTLCSAVYELQDELLQQADCNQKERNPNETKKPLGRQHRPNTLQWNKAIVQQSSCLRKQRNHTLRIWYDKTRLSSSKVNNKSFSSFERPTVEQIEHVLGDMSSLVKRTQLQRSTYKILGRVDNTSQSDKEEEHDSHLKQTDEEMFDDEDFYQQLLRQFIEKKTSVDVTSDSFMQSRHWLKLQRLRTKMKKPVDTKASKGRKIRYDVHSKLVGFMAPVNKRPWSDESCNQLVKSLFGK